MRRRLLAWAVRLAWVLAPLLLKRLYQHAQPEMHAATLPWAALRACPLEHLHTSTKYKSRTCALAAVREQRSDPLGQWSWYAFRQDLGALSLMFITMCAVAALTPRVRVPMLTTVGEGQGHTWRTPTPCTSHYRCPAESVQHVCGTGRLTPSLAALAAQASTGCSATCSLA